MRFGTGPVFAYERVAGARRWQVYAGRSFMVAALLTVMAVIAWNVPSDLAGNTARAYAGLGEFYFYGLIGVELAIVMLAAPAATAGAICVDRARGTLDHILATDLSDAGDRPGQAGRAAAAGPGPGRLLVAGDGDQLAAGRDRPARACPGIRDHRGRGGVRLHDGAGALRLGQKAVRSRHGCVYDLGHHPVCLSDLAGNRQVQGDLGDLRRGSWWPTPFTWPTHPTSRRTRPTGGTTRDSFLRLSLARSSWPLLAVWRMRPVTIRARES